jgi:hypothetical protein
MSEALLHPHQCFVITSNCAKLVLKASQANLSHRGRMSCDIFVRSSAPPPSLPFFCACLPFCAIVATMLKPLCRSGIRCTCIESACHITHFYSQPSSALTMCCFCIASVCARYVLSMGAHTELINCSWNFKLLDREGSSSLACIVVPEGPCRVYEQLTLHAPYPTRERSKADRLNVIPAQILRESMKTKPLLRNARLLGSSCHSCNCTKR